MEESGGKLSPRPGGAVRCQRGAVWERGDHWASLGPLSPCPRQESEALPPRPRARYHSFQRLTWGHQLEARGQQAAGQAPQQIFPDGAPAASGGGRHCCLAWGELGAASSFLLRVRGVVHR